VALGLAPSRPDLHTTTALQHTPQLTPYALKLKSMHDASSACWVPQHISPERQITPEISDDASEDVPDSIYRMPLYRILKHFT
jgi:hypothetical protein